MPKTATTRTLNAHLLGHMTKFIILIALRAINSQEMHLRDINQELFGCWEVLQNLIKYTTPLITQLRIPLFFAGAIFFTKTILSSFFQSLIREF